MLKNRENYRLLLKHLKENWDFLTFHSYKDNGGCLLRHDVDVSPWIALWMAEMENSLGVRSTYFFLLDSKFYNPKWCRIKEISRTMIRLGHDVGLHVEFDNFSYLCSYLSQMKFNFVETFGLAPVVFSLHNPSDLLRNQVGEFETIDGMRNAHWKELYRKGYQGDANDREIELPKPNNEMLYLNLHPCWWLSGEGSREDRIKQCMKINDREIHKDYMKRRNNGVGIIHAQARAG